MHSQILRINRRTVLKTAGAATAVGIAQPFVLYDAHAQTAVPVRLTLAGEVWGYKGESRLISSRERWKLGTNTCIK